MCFGKKDHYDPAAVAAKPTAGPPQQPTYASTPSKMPAPNPALEQQQYAPPPGPPPSAAQAAPAPISELPADDIGPPPGPPPSKHDDYTAPPPGPPPGKENKAAGGAAAHDWESVVPDTSLFPPPPDIFTSWYESPANNATPAEAEAGVAWCKQHTMSAPIALDAQAIAALEHHNIRLMQPQGYRGVLNWVSPGLWTGKTDRHATDTCIIGYPPLYAVTQHSPLASGRRKTVYYEVALKPDSRREETSLALGYTALPYPSFRLPGWHRGSLAVHGDDGHKYINDMWGGRSFTGPFKRGETVGIGMHFTPAAGRIEVEIFLTRDGVEAGRWDLHEETDAQQELPVTGLEGFHDLSCAIGTFNMVSFDVVFDPARWKYKGVQV